jgi:hypothetical protein
VAPIPTRGASVIDALPVAQASVPCCPRWRDLCSHLASPTNDPEQVRPLDRGDPRAQVALEGGPAKAAPGQRPLAGSNRPLGFGVAEQVSKRTERIRYLAAVGEHHTVAWEARDPMKALIGLVRVRGERRWSPR